MNSEQKTEEPLFYTTPRVHSLNNNNFNNIIKWEIKFWLNHDSALSLSPPVRSCGLTEFL